LVHNFSPAYAKGNLMKTKLAIAVASLVFAAAPSLVHAKGCLKGAAVGGAAGHVAGKHGAVGAAAGCVAGRHRANKQAKQQAATQQSTPQPENAAPK
jgi:hypothetical protein